MTRPLTRSFMNEAPVPAPGPPRREEGPRSPSPTWFRKHFNEDYLTIYSGRDESQAETEVELIVRELRIAPDDLVLDLCCGFGRHLGGFRRRGVRAVGVDLSLPLLRRVEPEPSGERAWIVCADMRALPFRGAFAPGSPPHSSSTPAFSVVVNFFTSFGYFETDEENLRALGEIERVLRPGGRFAIDLLNAETAVANLEPRSERAAGPFRLIEERSFDPKRRRIEKRIRLLRASPPAEKRYFESVRVFEEAEIVDLLARAGLRVERLLGDFEGSPLARGTPRMILLGSKPGGRAVPSPGGAS